MASQGGPAKTSIAGRVTAAETTMYTKLALMGVTPLHCPTGVMHCTVSRVQHDILA